MPTTLKLGVESELLAALRTPTRGRVHSLAIPLSNDLPALPMHGLLIFVALPLKIIGGTGSPIRPVALA